MSPGYHQEYILQTIDTLRLSVGYKMCDGETEKKGEFIFPLMVVFRRQT